MNLSEFDFALPEELIAQLPLAERSASRMLVVDRSAGRWEDRMFREFPSFLKAGDCVVLNDSRVFPARLLGHRDPGGGSVEVLPLRPLSEDRQWNALVRPGRRLRVGKRIAFDGGLTAEVVARGEYGERTVRFHGEGDLWAQFDQIGHIPLPPYIHRGDEESDL